VKEFTKDAAEQRRLETARLNKKYKDSPPASFKIMPKPGAYSERVKEFTKDAAEQRRLETARLNKKYKEALSKPPQHFLGLKKGGVIPSPNKRVKKTKNSGTMPKGSMADMRIAKAKKPGGMMGGGFAQARQRAEAMPRLRRTSPWAGDYRTQAQEQQRGGMPRPAQQRGGAMEEAMPRLRRTSPSDYRTQAQEQQRGGMPRPAQQRGGAMEEAMPRLRRTSPGTTGRKRNSNSVGGCPAQRNRRSADLGHRRNSRWGGWVWRGWGHTNPVR
jgi:hypothetical protein